MEPEPQPIQFHKAAASYTPAAKPSASLRTWSEAEAKAKAVVQNLSAVEKLNLIRGSHFEWRHVGPENGFFTGNTEAIPRFGIPALKMQDAGQGFRPTNPGEDGTTTSWPSLLALASSWDENLVRQVAAAIGSEFAGKGANVVLGPSVNVHRVARNGRNFEYISGEDPYLGSRLVDDFIVGVQEQGVIACVKHYAFNEQETDRMAQDSLVDDRTAWELYYPPFEAAVKAGAGAFMCSYNRVNGVYACENNKLLNKDLKGEMGFHGIVMSDWAATHSTKAIAKGLDVEMPGFDSYFGELSVHFSPLKMFRADVPQSVQDEAVQHILSTIYRLRLDEQASCAPPDCRRERSSDQATSSHLKLARTAATSAVTLLKNDGILPLNSSRIRRLAVIGSVASLRQGERGRDYYTGGGSGRVPGKYVVTPLEGIQSRAREAGVAVLHNPSNYLPTSLDMVKQADATVVVVGSQTGEGGDRPHLSLDDGGDRLIHEVAQTGKPTIVLMQTPGVVLTPWRHEVAALANLFLAGQETGNAWAAMLFGDVSPGGKLPIMFPATGLDVIEPGRGRVMYKEGLFTSYRSGFKAAFPFGHGLSFTNFSFSDTEATKVDCPGVACVKTTVTNTGERAGSEVAQAYMEFPAEANEPPRVLRGFQKTGLLQPGQAETVLFPFYDRDVSVYKAPDGWVRQHAVTVHVGASSEDIRSKVQVQL